MGGSDMRMKSAVVVTTTCAALLVACANHNDDFFGLGRWLDSATGTVDSLLFFLPQPQGLTLAEGNPSPRLG
jgi:hypothetical protein